jgi:hypothetical protein
MRTTEIDYSEMTALDVRAYTTEALMGWLRSLPRIHQGRDGARRNREAITEELRQRGLLR